MTTGSNAKPSAHTCSRTDAGHGNIFAAAYCMGCACWAASGSPHNGWTEPKLASAMAEYRMHRRGVTPEPQDTERAHKAFALARETAQP